MRWAGITDTGSKRSRNEDAIGLDGERGLFVLSDGMGGLPNGDRASRFAVEAVHDYLHREWTADLPVEAMAQRLALALAHVNAQLYEREGGHSGATCLAVRMTPGALAFAHVGDCRLLLYRGGALTRLNTEHSLVRRLIDDGHLDEDQARTHAYRNIIEQALGIHATLSPETGTATLQPGDRVLLASDGLWSELKDEPLAALLNRWSDPQACCDELVAAANAHGGNDNISVILIDLDDPNERDT